jgi:hypothetical protein
VVGDALPRLYAREDLVDCPGRPRANLEDAAVVRLDLEEQTRSGAQRAVGEAGGRRNRLLEGDWIFAAGAACV